MAALKLSKPVLVLIAGLVLLAGGSLLWLVIGRDLGSSGGSGVALIGGPFTLRDQTGATRRPEDFKGRYMLVDFGYTYCPDVCPSTLLAMTEALEILEASDPAAAGQVVPIFITIDPERDTVEALASYAENFHPDLVALTGSTEEIATAATAYRVYYRKAESEDAGDYLMDHSAFIYLMGPDGQYLTHFSHATSGKEMAEKIAAYLGA